MKKLILIGFATSGKSAVGKLLASRLNAKFVDTDAEIERQCGMSVQQIFDTYGERYFREKENQLLFSLACEQNAVVACGGGSVTAESFPQFAENGVVVWLTATAATVKSRLGNAPRPLFDGLNEQQLQQFIEARAPLYQRYATLTIPTDDLTAEQVFEKIVLLLADNI